MVVLLMITHYESIYKKIKLYAGLNLADFLPNQQSAKLIPHQYFWLYCRQSKMSDPFFDSGDFFTPEKGHNYAEMFVFNSTANTSLINNPDRQTDRHLGLKGTPWTPHHIPSSPLFTI